MTDLETTQTAAPNGAPDVWFRISKITNGNDVKYIILKL